MTYRLKNISIAIALALVAALLTSFYVSNYQRNVRKDEANVPIYVAAKDIPVGTSGAEIAAKGMLAKSEIVRRSVVPGSISNPTQVAQLIVAQPIYAGEQVSTRRFSSTAERGIGGQLKGTMRAFQLPGDQHQLLAGTLKPHDRVDVIASIKIGGDSHATRIILRDIEVLRAAGTTGTGSEIVEGPSGSVLLAVTDTQVQKLFHCSKHCDWSLELRPPVKASDSPEAVAYNDSILLDGLRGAQLERLKAGGAR